MRLVAAASTPPSPALKPGDYGTRWVVFPIAGGGVRVVGVPLEAVAALQLICAEPTALKADERVVEVIGPDELPVPFTATPPAVDGDPQRPRVATTIAFTPDRPGPYTVTARFEPSVGRVQLGFTAVVPRTDAGFALSAIDALPDDCTQFGILGSGAPVCLAGAAGTTFAVGAERLSGVQFAIDGEAIWVVRQVNGSSSVARFVPGLGFTHETEPINTADLRLIASNGEAIVAFEPTEGTGPRQVTWLHPEADGGLTHRTRSIGERFALGLAAGQGRLLVPTAQFRTGLEQTVVFEEDGGSTVTTGGPLPGSWSADDGTAWSDEVSLSPSGVQHVVHLLDHDGVRPRNRTVSFAAPILTDARLQPQLPVARFPSADGGEDLHAVLRAGAAPDLGWELYETGPGFGPVISATQRHAFARSLDGKTLKILDR